ncbi:hypothetical protein N7539_001106 [Penicillium diatomitis]|uniref:Uncharacterized protein n=1 Tax=Penicillium diatomitis TaxID=2819901 RepID=A0A9W9XNT5_9EURO|nr:uncharacterized protein N7539_001106 [Penicillium diatomitis]KAJ5495990.1 hypothetical protein N7539_001106 [Penicillium diatomitis]
MSRPHMAILAMAQSKGRVGAFGPGRSKGSLWGQWGRRGEDTDSGARKLAVALKIARTREKRGESNWEVNLGWKRVMKGLEDGLRKEDLKSENGGYIQQILKLNWSGIRLSSVDTVPRW